jgi:6-phosphogluconolactonase
VNSLRQTLVFDDTGKMADFFIAKWREISDEAFKKRGFFAAALSGGKTPLPFYRKLAGKQREIAQWNKTHIFFADERYVPDTDPDSNYRMIRETLLDSVGVPLENIHCIPTYLPDPISAAEVYEKDVALFFSLPEGGMPEFDLIALGIGTDGHTASLFPGSPALKEKRRLVTAVIPGGKVPNRITLTLPVLNKARNVIFLVTGKEKAKVVRGVLKDRVPSLPASLVVPERGSLLYLADSAAGSLLVEKEGKGR